MPVSLTQIDEKIGAKRALIAGLVENRVKAFNEYDSLSAEVDTLQAKDELTDEESTTLKAKLDAQRAKFGEVSALADKIRNEEAELTALNNQRELRVEANRQEMELSRQQDRQSSNETPSARGTDIRVMKPSKEQIQHDIASIFRCGFIAQVNRTTPRAVAAGEFGDEFRNDRLEAAFTQASNGSIIPPGYVPELIEFLRPASVIRGTGARQVPMPNGTFRQPRQTGAASSSYVGELVQIPSSQQTTDQITMTAKKLTTLVVTSGEAMRHANPSTDSLIRDDLYNSVGEREDITFIRGTQTSTVPGGLKWFADQVSSTQVIAANATVNLANVTADLGRLRRALRNQNVPNRRRYFLFHPNVEQTLMDMRDGNGNMGFPEMERGLLRGVPYLTTTQIPINLGAGTNQTEIYHFEATELFIGDTPTMDLQLSMEAAYDDGAGLRSAFQMDAAVFRLIRAHDTAMRHNVSVAYLSGATWAV